MTRVAIICPGPGAEAFRRDSESCVIAVNRAIATATDADVWAFSDLHTPAMAVATDDPRHLVDVHGGCAALCTLDATRLKLLEGGIGDGRRWLSIDMIEQARPIPPSIGWMATTATRAVGMAVWMGADQIDVYGSPLRGDTDWDGYVDDRQDRRAARWRDERVTWSRIAKVLKGRIIAFQRVGADDT